MRPTSLVANAGSNSCWRKGNTSIKGNVKLLLTTQPSRKAVFVDTDSVPAKDSRIGDLVHNDVEASLVQQITEAFVKGGVPQEHIGIISLYRQQIKHISHLLSAYPNIDILTADRSQGKDKECIIISLVRANEDQVST